MYDILLPRILAIVLILALAIPFGATALGREILSNIYRYFRKSRLRAWFMTNDAHNIHKADVIDLAWPAHLERRLVEEERRRQRELWASRALYVFCILIAGMILNLLLQYGGDDDDARIVLYVVGFIGAAALALMVREPPTMQFRREMIEHFSAAKGLHYFHGLQPKGDLDHAKQLGVLPHFLDGTVVHGINGELSGAKISMMEAQLWEGYGHNACTSFDGILIKTILPHPVDFLVYICPDRRGDRHELARLLPPGLERCRLEFKNFESRFEVFTSRQTQARALLSPSYIEKLMALANLWPGAPIHIAIRDRFMFISVNGAPLFAPQPRTMPMHSPIWASAIMAELNAIEHLASALRPFQRPGMSV